MQLEDNGNYKVGYRKPPVQTQFKKGQSGNPKGRPKREEAHWARALPDSLEDTFVVTIDGKKKELTMMEIIVERLIEQCLKGDKKALRKLFALREFVHTQGEFRPHQIIISGKNADL